MDNSYTEPIGEDDDLFTVEEFRSLCADRLLTDYDGFGHPARHGRMSDQVITPSCADEIPESATHIVWFNR